MPVPVAPTPYNGNPMVEAALPGPSVSQTDFTTNQGNLIEPIQQPANTSSYQYHDQPGSFATTPDQGQFKLF